jgi:hypothetical protein
MRAAQPLSQPRTVFLFSTASAGAAALGASQGRGAGNPANQRRPDVHQPEVKASPAMATPYEIDIQMSGETVSRLKESGFSLYAFKAVQTSVKGAAPTVWFKSEDFLETTQVIWQEQYQAYISTSQIIPNGRIKANTAVDIDLAETANADKNGVLEVVQNGAPRSISIFNQSNKQWTAGISQMVDGVANPMCALPLYGNMLDVIAPIEKVLLTFATATIDTGTVIYRAYSQGVLVDLTSAPLRTVGFDINNGWNYGGANWGKLVPAQEDLLPILIDGGARSLSVAAPMLAGHAELAKADAEFQILAGKSHIFPARTVENQMLLENRHNTSGTVTYQIAGHPQVHTIQMTPNQEDYRIAGVNGLQLTVINNLPSTLYCLY